MDQERILRQYQELKQKLLEVDFICPGSVTRIFQECGKPNCRCHQGKKFRHGPYYLWTRKVHGKTVTRQLTEQQALQCKQWIGNNRKLRTIIKQMQKLSSRAAPWCR